MNFGILLRITASVLCLAGPVLYNVLHLPVYVYLLSIFGVLALVLMDRKKTEKRENQSKRDENI